MPQLYWCIEGFDSLTKVYERKVKVGHFSETQIKAMLKALAAREGLSCDEIVGAYARKGTSVANHLLSVQKDGLQPVYSCGVNPHFTARIVRGDT